MSTYWYAIQCAAGNEMKVKERFDRLFQEKYCSFFPRRVLYERKQGESTTVTKPLFAGYFFFSSLDELFYFQAKELIHELNAEGVSSPACRILGMHSCGETKVSQATRGDTSVTAVNEEDMRLLLSLTDDDETIRPSLLYRERKTIKIEKGALKGHEGILIKFDKRKGRAKILLPFLGSRRMIDVAAEII